MAFTPTTVATNNIANLDDMPNDVGGLSAAQLKAKFDQFGADFVAWFNATHLQELNPNLIINGGCKVHQRVAVPNLSTAYQYGIDRIAAKATGTVGAGTITQNTSPNCGLSGTNLKLAGVTLTGSGIVYARYRMEAKDAAELKNKSVSIGCEAYHDVGSAVNYTIYVRKANTADNFGSVTAISNSDATVVASATATTVKYENVALGDCSNGLEIEIQAVCGAVTTKNFEFADIRANLGSKLAPFVSKAFNEELRACQRYYEKSYNYNVVPGGGTDLNGAVFFQTRTAIAGSASGSLYPGQLVFKVAKRAAPTTALYSSVTGTANAIRNSAGNDRAGVTGISVGFNGIAYLAVDNSSANAISLDQSLSFHWTTESEI